jgi:hypothetical protein
LGPTTRSSLPARSSRLNTCCSTSGVSPGVSGRIQIWMNRIGASVEAFCSECCAPEPRVMRCTAPAGSGPGAPPTESWWRKLPSTT